MAKKTCPSCKSVGIERDYTKTRWQCDTCREWHDRTDNWLLKYADSLPIEGPDEVRDRLITIIHDLAGATCGPPVAEATGLIYALHKWAKDGAPK